MSENESFMWKCFPTATPKITQNDPRVTKRHFGSFWRLIWPFWRGSWSTCRNGDFGLQIRCTKVGTGATPKMSKNDPRITKRLFGAFWQLIWQFWKAFRSRCRNGEFHEFCMFGKCSKTAVWRRFAVLTYLFCRTFWKKCRSHCSSGHQSALPPQFRTHHFRQML